MTDTIAEAAFWTDKELLVFDIEIFGFESAGIVQSVLVVPSTVTEYILGDS